MSMFGLCWCSSCLKLYPFNKEMRKNYYNIDVDKGTQITYACKLLGNSLY